MVVPLHGGLKLGTQPSELLRLAQRVRKSAKPKEGAGLVRQDVGLQDSC